MQHSPGFLSCVNEARPRVREITVDEARTRLADGSGVVLMDVREDSEWAVGHAPEAIHLGKGVLERDLERVVPDPSTELLMYCGGGYRSILTCDAAQRMGYRRVYSVIGGYKAMVAEGWRMVTAGASAGER